MSRFADLWLPARPSSVPAGGRLVVLPHAGCGTGQWFRWSEQAPPWLDVRVARLPGRETRINEPALTDPQVVIDSLGAALTALPPMPTVLFGHSLGAQFAFSICARFPGVVKALALSGSSAPGRRRVRERISTLPDDELAETAHRKWDAMPDDIRRSPGLRALFLPALRGDLGLAENWPEDDKSVLDLPMLVVAGKTDPDIGPLDIEAWCARTNGSTSRIEHEGGHMSVLTDALVGRRVISACIEMLLS